MWRCAQCETMNDDQMARCIICGNLRTEQEKAQPTPEPEPSPVPLPQSSLSNTDKTDSSNHAVAPCDEWTDEDLADPYDEYDEYDKYDEYDVVPPKAHRRTRGPLWAFVAIGALAACGCVFVVIYPYLNDLFIKRESTPVSLLVQQENEMVNLYAADTEYESIQLPTEIPTETPTETLTLAPITHVAALRSSYIYARADASTIVIGELKENEFIKFEGTKITGADGYVWYMVEYNDKYGWVSSKWTELARQNEVPTNQRFDYSCVIENNDCTSFFYWDDYYGELDLYENDVYEEERWIYITGDVNMRSGPNKGNSIIAVIKMGNVVPYLNEYSIDERGVMWYLISYRGEKGWVSSKYADLD